MIYTGIGKVGAGKSAFGLRLIAERLIETEDDIATTIVVRREGLAAYLQKRWPGSNVDIASRVRVLKRSEAREFWLHRGPECDIKLYEKGDPIKPALEGQEEVEIVEGEPNYSFVTKPVFYVIDEAHIDFDSRLWAKSSKNLTFYNSQHRKLGDNLWFITQFAGLIDTRIKGFSEEYVYFENNANMRYWGIFRGLKYCAVEAYKNERSKTGKNNGPCTWSKRYTFDKYLFAAYDTSGGVGIQGQGKPEEKRWKGISLLWAAPMALLAIWGIAQLPTVAGKLWSRSVSKQLSSSSGGAAGVPSSVTVAPTPAPVAPPVLVSPNSRVQPVEKPYPTGYVRLGSRYDIQMSDGSVLIEGQFERFARNGVLIKGEVCLFRPAPVRERLQSVLKESPVVEHPTDKATSAPSLSDEGAWVRGVDGVARLREKVSIL